MPKGNNARSQDIICRNQSKKLKYEIFWIAKNKGLTTSAFLRHLLHEVSSSYPAHMKRPQEDD